MSPALISLLKSVQALAMAYERQVAYLEQIGLTKQNVDELALEFGDSVIALPGLVEQGDLSAEEATCFQAIDKALDGFASCENCWSPEALRDDPRWQQVRIAAAYCLSAVRN